MSLHFLVVDGYPEASRRKFHEVGMAEAGELYVRLLRRHAPPGSTWDVIFPSDGPQDLPIGVALGDYDGMIWTGCNLTIYHLDDPRVTRQIELARRAYQVGVPAFGSCWGLQMAVVAAGGEVHVNPRGREMGVARKIVLTDRGRGHPMYRGKPAVFDGFISHEDEVTHLPHGAVLLASNGFTHVQAVEIHHGRGAFWATQYHPEYDLHEMSALLLAREERLVRGGFFRDGEDLRAYAGRLEELYREPERWDLRWQLGIDDDLLDDTLRQLEFENWLRHLVIPHRLARDLARD